MIFLKILNVPIRMIFVNLVTFVTPGGPLRWSNVVKYVIQTSSPTIPQPISGLPVALRDCGFSGGKNVATECNSSPWSSAVVMVKWFYINFRKPDLVTHQDSYSLPCIDATLYLLAGSTLFSTLGLALGYWQVKLHPADQERQLFLPQRSLWV